jgi:hypothetical protein
MNRLKCMLSIVVLTMIVSSTSFAGNIVGARSNRTGTIVGARTGNIVGARTGNIAGTAITPQPLGTQTGTTLDTFLYENIAGIFRFFIDVPVF